MRKDVTDNVAAVPANCYNLKQIDLLPKGENHARTGEKDIRRRKRAGS